MDFSFDSVPVSQSATGDRKAAGVIADPSAFLFQYQPGPATLARLVSLGGERLRMVLAEREALDSHPLPASEVPTGQFHPHRGVRQCTTDWRSPGGAHDEALDCGRHVAHGRVFCGPGGIEPARI